jgi:hypothetical protein
MSEAPKVWKEGWSVELDDDGAYLALSKDADGTAPKVRGGWTTKAQMQLASAAPDLVQQLLAIEACLHECTSCRERLSSVGVKRRHEHAFDCELVAALRKAGALPTGSEGP